MTVSATKVGLRRRTEVTADTGERTGRGGRAGGRGLTGARRGGAGAGFDTGGCGGGGVLFGRDADAGRASGFGARGCLVSVAAAGRRSGGAVDAGDGDVPAGRVSGKPSARSSSRVGARVCRSGTRQARVPCRHSNTVAGTDYASGALAAAATPPATPPRQALARGPRSLLHPHRHDVDRSDHRNGHGAAERVAAAGAHHRGRRPRPPRHRGANGRRGDRVKTRPTTTTTASVPPTTASVPRARCPFGAASSTPRQHRSRGGPTAPVASSRPGPPVVTWRARMLAHALAVGFCVFSHSSNVVGAMRASLPGRRTSPAVLGPKIPDHVGTSLMSRPRA